MRSMGMSQIEIARQLQVSDSSISSDIQYLREQAKGTIKEYVTEHLPEQYQVSLTALDEIIKLTRKAYIIRVVQVYLRCLNVVQG
jgi:transcriptional regulator